MRGTTLSAVGLALAATGLLAAGPAWADSTVCYRNKADYNDSTRIVLNVKFHSWLTGRQAVYEADGKHAFVENYKNRMAVFDGAVVTSRGLKYQPPGAHLGGESYWVRGAYPPAAQGGPTTPIEWDCTSAEYSATPQIWYCTITGGTGKPDPIAYTLERLPYPDQYCDTFQDTVDYTPPK